MRRIAKCVLFLALTCAFASDTPSAGNFHGCPISGKGGDPALSKLKNRVTQVERPEKLTIDDILAVPTPSVHSRILRSKWSPADRKLAANGEKRGVIIEGYVVGLRQQGPEASNCGDAEQSDFHVWIAESQKAKKKNAVVVEATPRWQEENDSWDEVNFHELAKEKAHVRITGWLLYDEDHGSEVGKSRATIWEIHPITKIEVERDGKWSELGE